MKPRHPGVKIVPPRPPINPRLTADMAELGAVLLPLTDLPGPLRTMAPGGDWSINGPATHLTRTSGGRKVRGD